MGKSTETESRQALAREGESNYKMVPGFLLGWWSVLGIEDGGTTLLMY